MWQWAHPLVQKRYVPCALVLSVKNRILHSSDTFFLWTASTFKQNTCWSKSCISVLFTSRSLFYYFNSVITALTVNYQCAIHYYLKSTLNLSQCSSRIITFAHSVSYYPFPNGLLKVSPVVVPLFSFELPISLFLEFNTIKSYYFI